MSKKLCLLVLFTIVVTGCTPSDDPVLPLNQQQYEPGVVISFDDDYVDNWAAAQEGLQQLNWKATFFVTKFDELTPLQISRLHDLEAQGHEVAAHGLNHANAVHYCNTNGTAAYMEHEINPMLNLMAVQGFIPSAFAYPYGARSLQTDNLLLSRFTILRGTTYGNPAPPAHNCYYSGQPVVYGLGLDNSYAHFNIGYFLSLLDYARQNGKIVIFYCHKPVEHANGSYQTEMQTLLALCNYVHIHNMRFYTISELRDL